MYFCKVIPFLYTLFLGILALIQKLIVNIIRLFRAITFKVTENAVRVIVHKTFALATQMFILAMENEQYDTCTMEGFYSKIVKKTLNLPLEAEIIMVISFGIREEQGVWETD